ncbi:MAG TPA: tetraacyldisaccharide 4'-kinase [Hyphomonadaceae bacterium]|jgi:tetraacyldisaccharide 4'-kinase|nr:tetraacyldisaccharide 4'-kinase [Hyphomonadaceae bacterium]
MNEPWFWRKLDPKSRASAPLTRFALTPLAMAYSWAGKRRLERTVPEDAGLPVICIGNLTLGGAGKTPVTAAVRSRLGARELRVASLSRGYRGSETGPLKVNIGTHTSAQVGDEPMMLAASGEAWISKDRVVGAKAMKVDGVQIIVMDDGHQNPTLKKALSLVVIDAAEPWGNGSVFPKGPLREPVARGLSRADGIVLMGDGDIPPEVAASGKPALRARLAPLSKLKPGRYIAFAGIGRPQRFFDSLRAMPDIELAEAVPYEDHHVFAPSDLDYLMKLAKERDAQLLTTDKDHVRLAPEMKTKVMRLSVEAKFEDEAALLALLARVQA